MASEDVIELGSSEDETEPPIKPLPDAMVHIPRRLHGVTIKPLSSNFPLKHKGFLGKSVAVTKAPHFISSPYRNKSNGSPLPKVTQKPFYRKIMSEKQIPDRPLQDKLYVNPINVVGRGPVVINRIPSQSKPVKCQIKGQGPKVLNNLPSSITVTRAPGNSIQKISKPSLSVIKNLTTCPSILTCKKDLQIGSNIGDVLTVELDDDEGSQSSKDTAKGTPQWYLKPEEHEEEHFDGNSLEVQNNMEPGPSNIIEITIEDSPVKPPPLVKRTCDVNNDLFITIEDSPIKPLQEVTSACDSDGEQEKAEDKVPPSKKKLNYPMEKENINSNNEMEMDSELVPEDKSEEVTADNTSETVNQTSEPISQQETSTKHDGIEKKPLDEPTEKDNTVQSKNESDEMRMDVQNTDHKFKHESSGEFHPVYQRFIDLCFELENSDDMQKIVEKKIKTYYRQVSKDYVESEDFVDMVSSKISLMKASPEKMFLYIKDIVDELNLQRKMAKSQSLITCKESIEDTDKNVFEHDVKYDNKRQRQIRKLEKTIKKLHRAIQKLEEQEVDFDDEEDSVYLLTERYKERLIRVHAKFCQVTNTKMPSEPHIQIECRPGQPPGPARRLEKWINKKVPIGTPLPFPDFHDVLKCVREANEEDRLGWNEVDIMEEARDLFTRCGKKLQRRRQENEWRLAASRITQDIDPAEKNETLKKKLDENKTVAAKKVSELFNKYADKQNQMKLEAIEIGDKEADESPSESEDEEVNDNSNSLEDRQKRKDRLRRLLQEKSKKNSNDKPCAEVSEDTVVSTSSQNKTNKIVSTNDKDLNAIEKDVTTMDNNESDNSNPINLESRTNNVNQTDVTVETDSKNEVNQEENSVAQTTDNFNKVDKSTENEAVENRSNNKINSITVTSDLKPEPTLNDSGRINVISDDSDADEFNLLQKLHSGNEISSPESSDCDSPIAISDTLESNSESENEQMNDVISIENSSYSESENTKDNISLTHIEVKSTSSSVEDVTCNLLEESHAVDSPGSPIELNKKYLEEDTGDNEDSEKILLASSEDEDDLMKDTDLNKCGSSSVNSKDDAISISESLLDEDLKEKGNRNDSANNCGILQNNNLNKEKLDCQVKIFFEEDSMELQNDVHKTAEEAGVVDCIKNNSKDPTLNPVHFASVSSDFNSNNEDSEKILLASSEDEDDSKKDTDLNKCGSSSVNSKDDAISIGESLLDEDLKEKGNSNDSANNCGILQNNNLNKEKLDCQVKIFFEEDSMELQNDVHKNAEEAGVIDCIKNNPKDPTLNPVQFASVSSDFNSNNEGSEKILLASSEDEDNSKKDTDVIKCGSVNSEDDVMSNCELLKNEVIFFKKQEQSNNNVNESNCELLEERILNNKKSDSDVHTHSQEDSSESQIYVNNDDDFEAVNCINAKLKENITQKVMNSCVEIVHTDCAQNDISKSTEFTESDHVIMRCLSKPDDHAHCKSSELMEIE